MNKVKGIVLAGGLGKRLAPLTDVTNKHLLPVYEQPMVYHPIRKMVEAGIEEVMLVTGGQHAGDFLRVLKNGKQFGLRKLEYAYQEKEGGIAEALGLAQDFADQDRICVILGDNIFEDSIKDALVRFREQPMGARIFLKEVPDPQRFGVAIIEGEKVIRIDEKPNEPKSNLAVTGIYMYDSAVWSFIKKQKPSGRGELEITDVNNEYANWGALHHESLKGWWTDAGTFESLLKASQLVAQGETK